MNIFLYNEFYYKKGDIIKKVVKTVALVTIFSCFERFLGFLYRIFLSRNLGSQGIGIYQITLSIVGVLVTITASGTPITVSRLMMKARAKNDKNAENDVISAGIFTSLLLSLPLTVCLYVFKNKLSFIFTDPRCYDLLLVILPSVVLTSVYACIRGVFWGNKSFLTYSLIELIEEVVMIIFGFALVSKMTSIFDGTIRAGYSIFISYVVSFAISTTIFIIQGGKFTNPFKQFLPLIESSMPITVMRTTMSLISSVVAILLPMRLVACGYSSADALSSYGELSGMTLPLLFIPSTLIGSIALVLVPDISEDYYNNNIRTLKNKISNAIKCSAVISCVIFPIFICCGKEIGLLVYSNLNSGIMLSVSSVMMLPMSITMITSSMLNSLNAEKKTLLFYLIGATFLIASIWILPAFCGVYALIWGHLISYVITSTLNLITLEKTFSGKISYKTHLAKTFLCAFLSTLMGYFASGILSNFLKSGIILLVVSVFLTAFNLVLMKIFNVFEFFKKTNAN